MYIRRMHLVFKSVNDDESSSHDHEYVTSVTSITLQASSPWGKYAIQ